MPAHVSADSIGREPDTRRYQLFRRLSRVDYAIPLAFFLGLFVSIPVAAVGAERDPSFAAAHPEAAVLIVSEHVRVFVHYDRDRSGISGTHARETIYWIRDRRGISAVNRQFRWTSPRWEIDGFDIEIESTDGERRRADQDDLDWIPLSDASDRVYRLDSEAAYTVVKGLRAGDLLRVRSRHRIRGLHGIRPVEWVVDGDRPVARRSLEISYPDDHILEVGIGGSRADAQRVRLTESERDGTKSRSFVLDRSHRESDPLSGHLVFTPHFVDVEGELSDATFAAGPDWRTVALGYARRVEPFLAPDEALARRARELVAGIDDDRTRVEVLYRHVQEECRYLGLFDGLGGILPERASVTAQRRFGDCKGLSALLIAMCRAAGIDAHPVLVRTRGSGPLDRSAPNLMQFDHFIAWADVGDGIWLDPTYDFCPTGLVPTANAASPVLLLSTERPGLHEIGTDRARAGRLDYVIEAELDEDGAMEAIVTETATDTAGLYRRNGLAAPDVDVQVVARSVLNRSLARAVTGLRSMEADWGQPTVTEFRFAADRAATAAGGTVYLPRTLVRTPHRLTDFAEHTTALDLRFAVNRSEHWSIALPRGAAVEPDSSRIEVPGLMWSYRVRQRRATLIVEREFRWQRRELEGEEVGELGEAIARIVEAEQGYLTIRMP